MWQLKAFAMPRIVLQTLTYRLFVFNNKHQVPSTDRSADLLVSAQYLILLA